MEPQVPIAPTPPRSVATSYSTRRSDRLHTLSRVRNDAWSRHVEKDTQQYQLEVQEEARLRREENKRFRAELAAQVAHRQARAAQEAAAAKEEVLLERLLYDAERLRELDEKQQERRANDRLRAQQQSIMTQTVVQRALQKQAEVDEARDWVKKCHAELQAERDAERQRKDKLKLEMEGVKRSNAELKRTKLEAKRLQNIRDKELVMAHAERLTKDEEGRRLAVAKAQNRACPTDHMLEPLQRRIRQREEEEKKLLLAAEAEKDRVNRQREERDMARRRANRAVANYLHNQIAAKEAEERQKKDEAKEVRRRTDAEVNDFMRTQREIKERQRERNVSHKKGLVDMMKTMAERDWEPVVSIAGAPPPMPLTARF